ncbi:hypothetical protein RJ640_027077, partial [Escallonia rubra]
SCSLESFKHGPGRHHTSPDIGNISFLVSLDISNNSFSGSLPEEMAHLRRLRELFARDNVLNAHEILATYWSSTTPVCNWVGVICSRRHNRVASLNLSNMGLVGTIPPDIGNISFLVSLDISNNSFSGSLPKEMAHLRRLRELLARYNVLSGELP